MDLNANDTKYRAIVMYSSGDARSSFWCLVLPPSLAFRVPAPCTAFTHCISTLTFVDFLKFDVNLTQFRTILHRTNP